MTRLLSRAFPSGGADLAVDLGTANTIVAEHGSGIVFNQPSICCFAGPGDGARLLAAGDEAHAMIGRVAKPLRIARPLRNGVLSDMAAGRELLRHAIRHSAGAWRVRRARALIGVPADATQAEQRALLTAAEDAGVRHVRLLPEPLMAAIGAGLDIAAARGRLVIDCGAGTTEVVVISLGSICLSNTVRIGGDTLDEALLDHLHLRHRFQIGVSTAERLKLELTELLDSGGARDRMIRMKGHNPAAGRPETLSLPASELIGVYEKHLQNIVDVIRTALHRTPPELSQDIYEDGILLTGGASMAGLLSQRIGEATGLATRVTARPLDNVALGLQRLLETGQN